MPRITTYACDVCSIEKKETNRWWLVRLSKLANGISLFPLKEPLEADDKVVCGEKCAITLISQFFKGLA